MDGRFTSVVVNERALTDDVLQIADEGFAWKGGMVARVVYHTFQNCMSDAAHVRQFRKASTALDFVRRRYGAEVAYRAECDLGVLR